MQVWKRGDGDGVEDGSSAVREKVLRFGRKARTLASTTNPKKAVSQPSSNFTTTSTLKFEEIWQGQKLENESLETSIGNKKAAGPLAFLRESGYCVEYELTSHKLPYRLAVTMSTYNSRVESSAMWTLLGRLTAYFQRKDILRWIVTR